MFQEKEIEAYKQIKAPVELKNRIALSVKKKKRKQSAAIAAAAAGFALFFLTNGWLGYHSTVLSVNQVAVSYQAVQIENHNRGISMLSSEQRSQIMIPLEINVREEAHIMVSEGVLQRIVEEEEMPVNQLDILGETVVYWVLDDNIDTNPICTITVGKETYQYLIAYQTGISAFTIQKMK